MSNDISAEASVMGFIVFSCCIVVGGMWLFCWATQGKSDFESDYEQLKKRNFND